MEEERFNELYGRFKADVQRWCMEYASAAWDDPQAEAEDMCQEAWIRIWQRLAAGYVIESPAFMETLTRDACRDYNRVHATPDLIYADHRENPDAESLTTVAQAFQDADLDTDEPSSILEAEELIYGLDDQCTKAELDVLRYLYIDEHEVPKVAKLMDTSEDVVHQLAKRVRQKAAALEAGITKSRKAARARRDTGPRHGILAVYSDSYGPSAIGRQVPNESVFPFGAEEEVYA